MATSSDQRSVSSLNRSLARASRWVLAGAIAGSALAVGTVHPVTLCLVAVALGVACALAWSTAEPVGVRSSATVLVLVGVGLTAYTAAQCVPIPIAWLAAIAPHNADVWSRALAPLHEAGPRWAPLSLDPVATRTEVLKGVGYLLTFVTALLLARRRQGVRFLAGALVITAVALAAAAVLHPAFGATKLFGVYEPGPGIAERHLAPLMNPNNLASYLNIGICLALAATLSAEPAVPRAIGGAVVLLLGATQLWVASRGGVIAMALGVALVIVVLRTARSQARSPNALAKLSIVAPAVTAAGAALIVLATSDESSNELFVGDTSKVQAIAHTMKMLPAVLWFGCGRGAFESAFPVFRTDMGHLTVQFPENVFAQWTLEWGLPVGLAGLALVIFALRPSAVLARSDTAAGAWAAVVAVSVQNLGDLGSEIPGLVVAGTVCAAIVVAGTPGHRTRWRVARWAKAPRIVASAAAASCALAVAFVVPGIGRGLHDDNGAAHDAALTARVPAPAMHALTRAAMLRHPGEPYLPFIAGLRAFHAHDESPVPWLGATLERAAVYAPAHLVLARLFAARSPAQARLEYRLTIEQAPMFDAIVMSEAPPLVRSFEDATELELPGKEGARVLELLVGAIAPRLPSTSVRLDAEIAARAPGDTGPVLRSASGAVEDLEADQELAPWCSGLRRPACIRDALEKTERARRVAPDECLPYALKARARIAAGEGPRVLSELLTAVEGVKNRVGCLQHAEAIARAAGDAASAEGALEQIVAAGCADDSECARQLGWVAAREEESGNRRKALTLYRRAYDRAPEDDSLLESIARLAAEAGLHAEAADDYDRLAHRHPGDPRWRASGETEREAALKAIVNL